MSLFALIYESCRLVEAHNNNTATTTTRKQLMFNLVLELVLRFGENIQFNKKRERD